MAEQHSDRKDNVLVDEQKKLVFYDFGLATRSTRSASVFDRPDDAESFEESSLYWCSPEVLLGADRTAKSDVWAVGCVVVEVRLTFRKERNFTDLCNADFEGNETIPGYTRLEVLDVQDCDSAYNT